MTVTPALLASGSSNAHNTVFNTASIDVVEGDILCLDVHSMRQFGGAPLSPSVSGLGIVWQEAATVKTGAFANLARFRAKAASTLSGVLTITFSAVLDTFLYGVTRLVGADTSEVNGLGAFAHNVVGSATTSFSTPAVALPTFGNDANCAFAAHGQFNTAAFTSATPEGGYTELMDISVADLTGTVRSALALTYRQNGGDLSPGLTWANVGTALQICATEIRTEGAARNPALMPQASW